MSNSFFEKLKKGMGIEESVKKREEAKEPEELEVKTTPIDPENKKKEKAGKTTKKEETETKKISKKEKKERRWFQGEGQLAIDVYQTESELVIQSAIAGVRPEDLEVSIEDDVITIKGERKKPVEEEGDYFSQECYWGPFSRQIILPVEVDPGRVGATLKEGILTIRIPKILREKRIEVAIKE